MVATTLDQYINVKTEEKPVKNDFIKELIEMDVNYYNYIETPEIVEKIDTDNLLTKDIAKLIRNELKKEIPDVKFSVTTHVFSMGAEINIECKKIPSYYIEQDWEHFKLQHSDVFTLFNGEPYDHIQKNNMDVYTDMFQSPKCFQVKVNKRLLSKVEEIVNKYHVSSYDYYGDYCYCNFYYHIRWDDAEVVD